MSTRHDPMADASGPASGRPEVDLASMSVPDPDYIRFIENEEKQAELEDERLQPIRLTLMKVLGTQWFEGFMSMVIVINFGIVIYETDAESQCDNPLTGNDPVCASGEEARLLRVVNICLLVIYAVELSLRLYAFRRQFFNSSFNCLDFVIVVFSLAFEFLEDIGGFSILRIIRLIRLLRAVRIAHLFRELYLLVHGFVSLLRALFWCCLMMIAMNTIWSIVAVKTLHRYAVELGEQGAFGEACERCPRAFETVFQSSITFFQTIILGDSWGTYYVPIIEKHPWTVWLCLGTVATMAFGLMNLILAVIVDCATSARSADHELVLREKALDYLSAKKKLLRLCGEMDSDNSGELSMDEIITGYNNSEEFANTLRLMDVDQDDLSCLFMVMDQDSSGSVTYSEFVDQLYEMTAKDPRTLLVFIKFHITDLLSKLHHDMMESNKLVLDQLQSGSKMGLVDVATTELRQNGSVEGEPPRDTTSPAPSTCGPLPQPASDKVPSSPCGPLPQQTWRGEACKLNSHLRRSESLMQQMLRLDEQNQKMFASLWDFVSSFQLSSAEVMSHASAGVVRSSPKEEEEEKARPCHQLEPKQTTSQGLCQSELVSAPAFEEESDERPLSDQLSGPCHHGNQVLRLLPASSGEYPIFDSLAAR